ncbi:hypothetical protein BB560_005747 [Smittium megazygosporum]|uniref:SAM domain-containing protein n=1 Tax=Smittium megazygosporum TaxID=133381 RepID=A0A2T9YY58_9FUNG|nr:hypothetical protein BB560_006296 [Smittium megazygosporum]PVU97282.1 hypothetical protein BB560_005747 [Smittium megazygosporum]
MNESEKDNVLSWNTVQVTNWLENNGFRGYYKNITDNGIDGEALVNMTNETLTDLGIKQLGIRLLILKRIYSLKLQSGIQIDADSFVPLVKESNVTLNTFVSSNLCANSIPSSSKPLSKDKKFGIDPPSPVTVCDEPFKSFKIGPDHTCLKVLPIALKKYNIEDDYRNYKLSIRTAVQGKKIEHVLDYDAKPLIVFQQLKEKGYSPIFVLKRLKTASMPEKKHTTE